MPEFQALLAPGDKPSVVVVASMAGVFDTFRLLYHSGGRLNVAGLGNTPKLRANPDRVANVLQQVRTNRKIERLIRYRPRPAVTEIRLNPPLLRIPRCESEFLVDVSVAARSKLLIRHRINHVICSGKWSSATPNVNDHRISGDGL
jgi:hypothetical protein